MEDKRSKTNADFSFTRFLVPHLMNYEGWAIFMDCDMLCQDDIANLWNQRNTKYSVMCVKHNHKPKEKTNSLVRFKLIIPKKTGAL